MPQNKLVDTTGSLSDYSEIGNWNAKTISFKEITGRGELLEIVSSENHRLNAALSKSLSQNF